MDLRELQILYLDIPIITRVYTTACFMTAMLVVSKSVIFCKLQQLNGFSLIAAFGRHHSVRVVLQCETYTLEISRKSLDQLGWNSIMFEEFDCFLKFWRLVSPFCYFGPIGFPLLFNMIFTYRYCRMLEEVSDSIMVYNFQGLGNVKKISAFDSRVVEFPAKDW